MIITPKSKDIRAKMSVQERTSWYRGANIEERLVGFSRFPSAADFSEVAKGRAARQLLRWRQQKPFDNPVYFQKRLVQSALMEAALLNLLGETEESLAERLQPDAQAKWLAQLQEAVTLYQVTPSHSIQTSLFNILIPKLEQGQSIEQSEADLGLATPLRFLLYYYLRRLEEGIAQVEERCSTSDQKLPLNPAAFKREWFAVLLARLTPKVSRTFALELNIARLQNKLTGVTSEERYQNFLMQLSKLENSGIISNSPESATEGEEAENCDRAHTILGILADYPVLARALFTIAQNWLDVGLEFLERLCVDWQEIARTFPEIGSGSQLSGLDGGVGDLHQGGRSVLILTFDNGAKLVYKPRNLGLDEHFQELLAWLNGKLSATFFADGNIQICEQKINSPQNILFRTLRVLNKQTHGWCEFVTAEGCTQPEQVSRFYRRQGAYLALFYALRGTDFHYENLIAAGEQPVPIDLETVFQPQLARQSSSSEPIPVTAYEKALFLQSESVLKIGLLPGRVFAGGAANQPPLALNQPNHVRTQPSKKGAGAGIDISGLGGTAGQLSPNALPYLAEVGTDRMHTRRQQFELAASQNQPTLNGHRVEASFYMDELTAGFRGLYEWLLNHKVEFAEVLKRFADDKVRIILRPTRTYALLLGESFHPDLLRDGLERDRHFDRLWVGTSSQPALEAVIEYERRDLWAGDIPYFEVAASSVLLQHRGEQVGSTLLQKDGLASVLERLAELSQVDLDRQLWFIQSSFVTAFSPSQREENGFVGRNTGSPLASSKQNHKYKGGRSKRRFAHREIASVSSLAPQIGLSPIRQQQRTALETNGFLGLALHAGSWLAKMAIVDGAESPTTSIFEPISKQTKPTAEKTTVSWLNVTTSQNGQIWQPLPTGPDLYAGLPGIGLFLAYLGQLSGQPRFTRLAQMTLNTCRQLLKPGSYRSVSAPVGSQGLPLGVFQGIGGLIYFYSHLAHLWQQPTLLDEAVQLARLLEDNETIAADHEYDIMAGAAGNILVLLGLYRRTGISNLLTAAQNYGWHLVKNARSQPGAGIAWSSYLPSSQPLGGFSHGVAGIAYSLLELAKVSQTNEFRQTALSALTYERTLFDPASGNWRDVRDLTTPSLNSASVRQQKQTEISMVAWCHGGAGITLARLASLQKEHLAWGAAQTHQTNYSQARAEVEEDIIGGLNLLEQTGWQGAHNDSLCHGTLGNLEVLQVAAQLGSQTPGQLTVDTNLALVLALETAGRSYTRERERMLGRLGASPEAVFRTGLPLHAQTPGLMTGIAGIGYGCLRLAYGDAVPSVLLLEFPS
jgi:lantibiotic modifying enzyme